MRHFFGNGERTGKHILTICLISTSVLLVFGCPQGETPGGGDQVQGPDSLDCPFERNDPAYSLTIPCGTLEARASSEIPNADYESYFFDEARGQTYVVAVVAPEFTGAFSGGRSQTGIGYRFDGTMRTSSGDYLITSTAALTTGDTVSYAHGLLADGRLLQVGTGAWNPLKSSFFASVEMVGTDGSDFVLGPREGARTLAAPPPEGIVLLDNGTGYEVTSASDKARLVDWFAGATVFIHVASTFPTETFFLTLVPDWFSVEAEYLGVAAAQGTITEIRRPEFADSEVVLSDGTTWRVSGPGDEQIITGWVPGDPVAVFRDAALFGDLMLHVPTGRTITVY